MANKKQMIQEEIGYIEIEKYTLDEILKILDGYRPFSSSGEVSLIPKASYGGYYNFDVVVDREETDEEYKTRLEKEMEQELKEKEKEISKLIKKKNLTPDEKEKLHEYIRNK